MMIEMLEIKDKNAHKPDLYYGSTEIIPAWRTYCSDYDNAENNGYDDWCNTNSFRVLIERDTHELIAIRDYGMYMPNTTDFLIQTNFLPISTHHPEDAASLEKRALETLDLFEREIAGMKTLYPKPLFLAGYLGDNNYITWSIVDNKPVYVYDYKSYRDQFKVSDYYCTSAEACVNTAYGIMPPSRQLINAIDDCWNLYPEIWSSKMRWDDWERRDPKKSASVDCTRHPGLYDKAISVINMGRSNDYGCDDAFADLESRVSRYERLDQLGAPEEIMDKEAALIIDAMENLKLAGITC